MKCDLCKKTFETTNEWYGHNFCDKCLISLLVEVVKRFEQWSPADAEELIESVLRYQTDQAASLRRMVKKSEVV